MWQYKGTLKAFSSDETSWTGSLPCVFFYQGPSGKRPQANCDYLLEGTLQQRERFAFSFKPTCWRRVEQSYSPAELRLQAKEKILHLLQPHMEARSALFLTALFSGDLSDRMLRFEFSRVGLQHILAISGFHFALLAGFSATLLRPLFPYRTRLFTLLGLSIVYFIFIGSSPSVLRSFLAAALFFTGGLLGRKSSGLNLLGACLLFEISLNPLCVLQVGFQLSFMSCAAILLFNAPTRSFLARYLPKRSFQQRKTLSLFSRCASIPVSFFARSLSLTLAVHLVLLPLLLYHFHRFPYLSLLYNLFIPSLSALCLFLLLPALALHALYPLFALPFFKTAGLISGELLEIAAYPPALLDAGLNACVPGWALPLWLSGLLALAITLKKPKDLQY